MSNWGTNAPILYFASSFISNSFTKTLADVPLYLSSSRFPCLLAAFLPSSALLSPKALSSCLSHPVIPVQAPTHPPTSLLIAHITPVAHELLLKSADGWAVDGGWQESSSVRRASSQLSFPVCRQVLIVAPPLAHPSVTNWTICWCLTRLTPSAACMRPRQQVQQEFSTSTTMHLLANPGMQRRLK